MVSGTVTVQATGQPQSAKITFVGFENGVPDSVRWERRMTDRPIYTRYDSNSSTNTGRYQISLPDNYTWIGHADPYLNGAVVLPPTVPLRRSPYREHRGLARE